MKFTKEQLTQIISEGITKGIAKSQNFKFLTENTKIKIGMQGDNVDPKAPGDTKRVGRYIDNLDNVAEFISAVPMFIEYLLEYKEEKANIDHLRKAARSKFDEMGAPRGLADLFVTVIQRAAIEVQKAKKEMEKQDSATPSQEPLSPDQ
tara:strand:- start:80 stop:526 length:447 start_codon:yes stop_codon:yes gene_type:complete